MSTKSIEAFRAHRSAPTLPPPPDMADHIMRRVAKQRELAAQLLREADELERVALAQKALRK